MGEIKQARGDNVIEELKILSEIFGDLSAVGIWAIVSYFVYKVLVIAGWLCALQIGLKAIKHLYNSLAELREREKINVERYKSEAESAKMKAAEYKAESERVQHMYKLLKEAK